MDPCARVEVLILSIKGQKSLVNAVQSPFYACLYVKQATSRVLAGDEVVLWNAVQGEHCVTVDGPCAVLCGGCKSYYFLVSKLWGGLLCVMLC